MKCQSQFSGTNKKSSFSAKKIRKSVYCLLYSLREWYRLREVIGTCSFTLQFYHICLNP